MRIPLSWLQEHIEIDMPNEQLADLLTLGGLEVNKIEQSTPLLCDKVLVSEIKDVKPHPYADKLQVVQVFDGTTTLQVVCGDQSCTIGMKSALAPIGATIMTEKGVSYKIKRTKLRKVESFGMLCTEKELGLSDHNATIMHVDRAIPIGTDLYEFFSDTVLDISLTPNLGHCMSILGVARDLAALLDKQVKLPRIKRAESEDKLPLHVTIKDPKNCYRYSCRLIRNVVIGPSPIWIKMRLKHAGIRSINNVVDITNYVMLELGQPLHAFDYSQIDEGKIVVQPTETTTMFELLDKTTHTIPSGVLMVYGNTTPLAIAGIMGGSNSEIQNSTTDIVLEGAHFNPSSIRKSSRLLNIRSESSLRFERGVNYEMVTTALDHAIALIIGDKPRREIDVEINPQKLRTVTIRIDQANQLLGTTLSYAEAESILNRLDMKTISHNGVIEAQIPPYRNDLYHEVDLIEELARVYGYNNIKKRKAPISCSALPHSPIYLLENRIREHLRGMGLQELITSNLISPKLSALSAERTLGKKEEIHVLKPNSLDHAILRTSLLPGMLQVVKHNFDRMHFDIAAFEIGCVHFKDGKQYKERATAALLLTGKSTPHHWDNKSRDCDFFDLKGIIENTLQFFLVKGVTFKPSHLQSFHPYNQALILINEIGLGAIGEVNPYRLQHINIERRIFFAQLDLHDLFKVEGKNTQFVPLPQFPGSERDWTLTLNKEIPIAYLFDTIEMIPTKLLKRYVLLDIYENATLGSNKKNITIRFFYRNDSQTVKQSQVEKEHTYLMMEISKKIDDFIC